jgi:hypothetical protein
MSEKRRRISLKMNKKRAIMLGVGATLLLAIGIMGLALLTAKDDLVDQTLFLRWTDKRDYAQNSIFFDPRQKVTDKDIQGLRYAIEAGYKAKSELATFAKEDQKGEMHDAYSATAPLPLSTDHGQITVDAIAVGGDFFLFHPVKLVYGSYIKESDLMHDYVLLDEETASVLFGGSDVVGKRVSCNGKDLYVIGVYERKKGEVETLAAGNADPKVFVSYDVMKEQNPDVTISCYELLSPNPIPHFAKTVLEDLKMFPEDRYALIENSTRFSYSRYYDLVKARKSREMRTDSIAFPYWENLARYQEGRLMYVAFIQCMLAIILFVMIVVNLLVLLVKYKPTRQELESAVDVLKRKARAKHMAKLMKESENEQSGNSTGERV